MLVAFSDSCLKSLELSSSPPFMPFAKTTTTATAVLDTSFQINANVHEVGTHYVGRSWGLVPW